MTCKNGHDSRCGFSKVEDGWSRAKSIRLANVAMKERIENPSDKQRMSHYLQTCEIPQITDDFIQYSSSTKTKACALGALHIGAGGDILDEQVDWYGLAGQFDVKSIELDRFVKCPTYNEYLKGCRCPVNASIAEIVYHLNDSHEWLNFAIGLWLEKYQL